MNFSAEHFSRQASASSASIKPVKVFTPYVQSADLAELNGSDPIDTAVVEHMLAGFAAGELVGYTGWLDGEYPEVLDFEDGQPIPNPKRPFARNHDPLPWTAACCTKDDRLLRAMQQATVAHMRLNLAAATDTASVGHKGGDAAYLGAWVIDDAGFGGNKDSWGHHGNWENYLFLHITMGHPFALQKWQEFIAIRDAEIAAGQDLDAKSGRHRDTHAWMVQEYLAYVSGNGSRWYERMRATGIYLMEVPLHDHNVPLYNPLWVLFLWYVFKDDPVYGTVVRDWLLQGGNAMPLANDTMVLHTLCYRIDNDTSWLTRHAADLAHYVDSGYHGVDYKWHGVSPVGRRGSGYVELQWPIFKRALLDSGVVLDTARKYNSIPLDNKHAILHGADVTKGTGYANGLGGDVHSLHLYFPQKTGYEKYIEIKAASTGANELKGDYDFGIITNETIEAYNEGSLFISGEYTVNIVAGKTYELGLCHGILHITGEISMWALQHYCSLFTRGKPTGVGLWWGLTVGQVISVVGAQEIDMRGHKYAKWAFTTNVSGYWEPLA